MRLKPLAGIVLAICPLAPMACSGNASDPVPGEKTIRIAQPIQGGTVDQTDSAVVAILINSGGLSLCSGTLVAKNLVLSAHHCVANNTTTSCGSNDFGSVYGASSFVVTTSYDAAATVFNSANPRSRHPMA